MVPNYANLFMGKFEGDHVYNNDPYKYHLTYYAGFIDDIFLIWSGSEEGLEGFASFLNSRVPSIKFTCEKSKEKILFSFLDVAFHKDNAVVNMALHRKSTDRNTLLLENSCHPTSLKCGLPLSQ